MRLACGVRCLHEAIRPQAEGRGKSPPLATADGRAVVTRDVVDFVFLSRQMIATNTEHAGINLVQARRSPGFGGLPPAAAARLSYPRP